jgi:hypothetical protein
MPGGRCGRAANGPVGVIVLTALGLVFVATGAEARPAAAQPATTTDRLSLPQPVRNVDPLTGTVFKFRPDRLKTSSVPGPTADREDLRIAVGPTGAPQAVVDTQRLVIHGAGNYVIRELGPARAAVGIGDTVPPVLELGTVVWQGFSPDRRALAATLTLDAAIEAARVPLRVQLALHDRSGAPARLRPGGESPVDGTVDVTLVNQTHTTRTVDGGVGDPNAVAAALDRLRVAADHPRVAVPPTAGAGLPGTIPGALAGQQQIDVVAPLRITGTVTVPGGHPQITGPGTTPVAGGVAVEGTLAGSVTFTVPVRAGQRLALELHVQPWLDPRTLQPPGAARSWRQWSAGSPTSIDVAQATALLMSVAAASAHAAEYSPYLQAHAPGPDLSTFTYVMAPEATTRRAAVALQPHPVGITLTALAALAIVGNAALLRRVL